jgi:hypothetical protein
MARNKKRFDVWTNNPFFSKDYLMDAEHERLRLQMQREQQMQLQYNGYGGGYSPIGAATTTGTLTYSQPIVMDVVGNQYSVLTGPAVFAELPPAKEDPLAWLDRRVDEICKVGAIK